MTRNEFIQRAVLQAVIVDREGTVIAAVKMADMIEKVAPFDDKNEIADAIDSLYQKLDGIYHMLDSIVEALPGAGRGS